VSDTLVDSNVLLDVLTNDPAWAQWSADRLAECADNGVLCINALIYAEVSIGFRLVEEVEAALPHADFRRLTYLPRLRFWPGRPSYNTRGSEAPAQARCPTFSSARMPPFPAFDY
jgi:hypothetical protein